MRAFLMACVAMIVIGAGAYFGLNSLQKPSGIAYSTDGARINPQWSWRAVFRRRAANPPATQTAMQIPVAPTDILEECAARTAWQWVFVDFGDPAGESNLCSDSQ